MKRKMLAFATTLLLMIGLMPASFAFAEGVPSKIDAATVQKVAVKTDVDGFPYFEMQVQFPQSFMDLYEPNADGGGTWIDYYWKIDNGSWEYLGGGYTDTIFDESYGYAVAGQTNTYCATGIYPQEEDTANAIVIKDHNYTLKVKLSYGYYDESEQLQFVSSAFSNEVSIGSGSFYAAASEWAKPELQNADDLGLIPDILRGADMTKPITREEFCELAVLLYEKTAGITATAVSPNPFTDTTNAQILKAYNLGITTGTSATTFSPKVLINREQCAAMLYRAIKVISPNGDYSITGVKDFPDQKNISSWAVEATKYMFKAGIITGDAKGNFMPKATTSAQVAAGYGMATREQAIALTVRTYEEYK